MEESEVLFKVFGILDVTAEVITSWIIMAVVIVVSFIGTRRLKDKPGLLQNALELAVGKLEGFFSGVLGSERCRMCFPFLATLFIYIIISNFVGLIPGAGETAWLKAPTSSLSVTAGLGVCVFVMIYFYGFKTHKMRYFKHYIMPVFLMVPFMLLDEIVRPVSLALRLYGNIFGDESVTEQFYGILPIGLPVIMMLLSLLFCSIQAVVYTMLTAIYIEEATDEL